MKGKRGEIVIRVSGLVTRFGATTIHNGLDLEVHRGQETLNVTVELGRQPSTPVG